MEIANLHSWQLTPAEAIAVQRKLADQVSRQNEVTAPRFIAGLDISVDRARGTARGAVVVFSYPELQLIEVQTADGSLDFPYIPGLLSFREAPLTLAACEKLKVSPDLFLVDGQGIAHPRRMGLASHLGLFLGTPTIGCAKSLLCGRHGDIAEVPGSYSQIIDKSETVGAALRTRAGVKPVYISIGHKVDLDSAMHWALECCRGYRLPEPCRFAHLAAGDKLKEKAVPVGGTGYQLRF